MKGEIVYEKLNEEDIQEIVMEYLQEKHNLNSAQIIMLGNVGEDLRCVCALKDGIFSKPLNLEEVDKQIDFTGDHEWLKKHSEFLF